MENPISDSVRRELSNLEERWNAKFHFIKQRLSPNHPLSLPPARERAPEPPLRSSEDNELVIQRFKELEAKMLQLGTDLLQTQKKFLEDLERVSRFCMSLDEKFTELSDRPSVPAPEPGPGPDAESRILDADAVQHMTGELSAMIDEAVKNLRMDLKGEVAKIQGRIDFLESRLSPPQLESEPSPELSESLGVYVPVDGDSAAEGESGFSNRIKKWLAWWKEPVFSMSTDPAERGE